MRRVLLLELEAVLLLGRGKREVTLQAAENQRRH